MPAGIGYGTGLGAMNPFEGGLLGLLQGGANNQRGMSGMGPMGILQMLQGRGGGMPDWRQPAHGMASRMTLGPGSQTPFAGSAMGNLMAGQSMGLSPDILEKIRPLLDQMRGMARRGGLQQPGLPVQPVGDVVPFAKPLIPPQLSEQDKYSASLHQQQFDRHMKAGNVDAAMKMITNLLSK